MRYKPTITLTSWHLARLRTGTLKLQSGQWIRIEGSDTKSVYDWTRNNHIRAYHGEPGNDYKALRNYQWAKAQDRKIAAKLKAAREARDKETNHES